MQSIGKIYECECKQSIKVSERNTLLSNVTGLHVSSATNLNVEGIHIIGASYMPIGIETFFPNLIGLSMEQHLKEITQNDLQPFPNLKHLWMARNQLAVIEKDLFKYNPELIYISLRQNFIKEIDSNVFDHLRALKILELDRNDCIEDNAVGRFAVMRLIQQLKEKCAAGVMPSITPITTMQPEIQLERLTDDQQILNEKLSFWRNFCIILLSLVALVVIVGVFVLVKKHGVNGGFKFVSFRNV